MDNMEATLLILRNNNKILIALKKRGFGKGKLNGVGGKLEKGETAVDAMIRETNEEIGVIPTEFEKVGKLDYIEFYKENKVNMHLHIYTATKWDGEPIETEEMKPEWVSIKEIPYSKMFQDDQHWLPQVLEGKKVKGFFEFDENMELLSHNVTEVELLED
ncbi:MAG: 8-oxo-dGTP diphosphatase [Lachnospiraceae bacterium]|jgi:mutator protein MutT|nr:8-oxo-dGTP diphosphatase [Lachnospiraceae bacterium]